MKVNGIRPNHPLINSNQEQVGFARTFGDAYEIAQNYMSEHSDPSVITWGHMRFEGEGEAPVQPEERPFVQGAINYGSTGSGDRWATDPSARLFDRDYFKAGEMWRIPDRRFTYFAGGVFIPPVDQGPVTFEVLGLDGTISQHTWDYDFS